MLEQRAQLQSWLHKLDSVGEEADTRVVQRVRADYLQRLEGIGAALAAHTAALEAELNAYRSRLGEATARHEAARERFEEAQLRYRIGELGEDDWAGQRQELESALVLTREELDRARAEVRRLEEVMADLPGAAAAAPARPSAPPVERAEVEAAAVEAAEPPAVAEPPAIAEVDDLPLVAQSPEPLRAPRPAPRDAELQVGDDVVEISLDDDPAAPGPTAHAAPPAAGEQGDASPDDTLEYLAPLPALEESPASETGTPAQGGEADGGHQDLAFLEELDRAIAGATHPPAEPATPDDEEDPELVRPQPGTRCRECGYTNDVGAWFCGVCRADLT